MPRKTFRHREPGTLLRSGSRAQHAGIEYSAVLRHLAPKEKLLHNATASIFSAHALQRSAATQSQGPAAVRHGLNSLQPQTAQTSTGSVGSRITHCPCVFVNASRFA